jgi:hypothetical protein
MIWRVLAARSSLPGDGFAERGRLADYLTRMDFVVLDELGCLPFAQTGGQLLFHLISRLYEVGIALGESKRNSDEDGAQHDSCHDNPDRDRDQHG